MSGLIRGRSLPIPDTGWKRPFEDPIILPNGSKLVTLLDAGNYIASRPRKEKQTDRWQFAIEALTAVTTCARWHAEGAQPACRA